MQPLQSVNLIYQPCSRTRAAIDFFMISGLENDWLVRGLVCEPDGIWWWFLIVRMEIEMVLVKVLE